jgi:hypothetical protein
MAWKRSPGFVLASSHVHITANVVTNCLLHKLGGHCTVNTTRDSSDYLGLVANKLPDPSDLLLDKVAHDPVGLRSANVDTKVAQEVTSTGSLSIIV